MFGHAALGRYALGQMPSPVAVSAAAGAFALTGANAALSGSIVATTGSFAAAGGNVAFLYAPDTRMAAGATFSLNGASVEFARGRRLAGGVGEFRLIMSDAGLFYSSYPSKMRVFPSVGRGARTVSRGTEPIRVFASTGHGTRRRAFGG